MNFNCKSLFILFISLAFIAPLIAQQDNKIERSISTIKKIKDGVLVIRLASKNNKVKELNRLIASPDISAKTKQNLEKNLHETVSEIKGFNTKVYYGFTEVYNFSEVLFMYDTATISLKKGIQQGYFLDKNLNVDPSISLKNRSFALLRYGSTNPDQTSGLEAFVVMDDQFKDLTKPFPYYVNLKSFGQKILSIFSTRSMAQIKIISRVSKLNKKFEKFYHKAVELPLLIKKLKS